MPHSRVLVTGAAGALGRVTRAAFRGRYPTLRLSDITPMDPAGPGEEVVVCDLSDGPAVIDLCRDVDAIVHFGGRSTEGDWPTVMAANIVGVVNLWEAARINGVDRVLFASSNHAIGFHPRTSRLDHRSPPRPDSRYGLSKAFGEDTALYYALKHGVRGFSMRIGSCFPEPTNARMLSTWLSYADLARLLTVGLTADYVCEIVYGVSANTRSWWDNSNAERLGYRPEDNAETFAAAVGHIPQDDPMDETHQGGGYLSPDFSGRPDWVAAFS